MLSGLLYCFPILNKFRFPFKLMAFSNFYLIFAASIGLHFFVNLFHSYKIKQVIFIIVIASTFINFLHLYKRVYVSFNNRDHFDKIPLNETYLQDLSEGRIFSLAEPVKDPFSVNTLGFNYPLLLGLNQFAGYDPLMPKKNFETCLDIKYRAIYGKSDLPIDYLRNWGVNWYILNKDSGPIYSHYQSIFDKFRMLKFTEEPGRIFYLDKNAKPLIFWENDYSRENIEYIINTNSLDIHTNSIENDYLIINWLNNDNFSGIMNNKIIKINDTEIGQMKIFVPKGINKIRIKYVNPYLNWSLIIVITFTAALLLIWRYHSSPKLSSPKSVKT